MRRRIGRTWHAIRIAPDLLRVHYKILASRIVVAEDWRRVSFFIQRRIVAAILIANVLIEYLLIFCLLLADRSALMQLLLTLVPPAPEDGSRPPAAPVQRTVETARIRVVLSRSNVVEAESPTPRGCREILLSPAGLRRSSSMRRRDRG